MNLLTIEHLTKSYTERLLFDDTAFSINEGEKVGLIGINGTGKSTLLRIAAGLEQPDEGSVVRGAACISGICPRSRNFRMEKPCWRPLCVKMKMSLIFPQRRS